MKKPVNSCKLIVALTALLVTVSCSRNSAELRFVTPKSSVDQEIAADLADLFGNESEITLTLTTDEMAGEAALDAILNGSADLALVSNALPYREGITTIIPLFPTVLHIGYFEGREFTNGKELLQGATVYAGPEGSASRMMFELSAKRLGLTVNDYSYVSDLDVLPDVVVVFAPISPDRLEDFPDFRLFSAGSPEDIGAGSSIDAATLLNPHLKAFVIPVGTYGKATPEPVLTVAVDKMLVARRDLDNSVVYDFVTELLRLRPALAAKRPGLFTNLSGDFDPSRSTFVLHAGSQAYLQRSAPTIYERYSGVAEVAVTLFIALASAVFGGVRIYRMRRKNRIDVYYSQTIEIRNSSDACASQEERLKMIDKLRKLQNKAFEELVDERLAADESFRIFITLSNDVLRQLGANYSQLSLSDE